MRNKFTRGGRFPDGIPSMVAVGALEEHWARLRLIELVRSPLLGHFDYEHMKAIHRHIFQDTFAWAGQERSAPMGGPMIKFGPDVSAFPDFDPRDYSVPHEYAPAGWQLTEAATHEYALLQEADYLRGMALSEFVDNLALRWVSLTVVHSFREGNTRSQLVFSPNSPTTRATTWMREHSCLRAARIDWRASRILFVSVSSRRATTFRTTTITLRWPILSPR